MTIRCAVHGFFSHGSLGLDSCGRNNILTGFATGRLHGMNLAASLELKPWQKFTQCIFLRASSCLLKIPKIHNVDRKALPCNIALGKGFLRNTCEDLRKETHVKILEKGVGNMRQAQEFTTSGLSLGRRQGPLAEAYMQ